jgi:hypothetical protein
MNSICNQTTTLFKIMEIAALENVAFALVSGGANHNMQTNLDW